MAKERDIFNVDPDYDPSESPILGNPDVWKKGSGSSKAKPKSEQTTSIINKFGSSTKKTAKLPKLNKTAKLEDEPTTQVNKTVELPGYGKDEDEPKKPKLWARLLRFLIMLSTPLALLMVAIRLLSTSWFLVYEYARPNFPSDKYGFTATDRVHYGSYVVNYLNNADGPRYLSDIVMSNGTTKTFTPNEVSHMVDVKALLSAVSIGAIAFFIIASILGLLLFRGHNKGGMRKGLFNGSIFTIVLMALVGFLARANWSGFFNNFHQLLFPKGNWQFPESTTLIRLFPSQFWVDAGAAAIALTIFFAVILMILARPRRKKKIKS
ncbi:MAG: TIGR01906 family membrane protein [Micrococcaceae bacterium]